MNKFKFGDKVTHCEFGLGLVLGCYLSTSKNVYFYNVAWSVLGGGCSPSHFVESSLTPVSEWIPCSERMPNAGFCVLVLVELNGRQEVFIDSLYKNKEYGMLWQGNDNLVTHWMPLPELPK